jgi:hypothetical protein
LVAAFHWTVPGLLCGLCMHITLYLLFARSRLLLLMHHHGPVDFISRSLALKVMPHRQQAQQAAATAAQSHMQFAPAPDRSDRHRFMLPCCTGTATPSSRAGCQHPALRARRTHVQGLPLQRHPQQRRAACGAVPLQPRRQRHFGDARRRRPRSLWGQAHGQGTPSPPRPHHLPCV